MSKESTRGEVGRGGNEDTEMGVWSHQAGIFRREGKVGETPNQVQGSRLKWYSEEKTNT